MNELSIQEVPATYFLLLANILFSISGFQNHQVFNQYKFDIYSITKFKDYKRLITSGFLHADWMHLIFNMYVLYSFGKGIEANFGTVGFITIYVASLIFGSLLSLFFHRNNTSYTAVGASGAVSGILFAFIAIAGPEDRIYMFLLPFPIYPWVFGIIYLLISMYGIKTQRDNIGHEAHFGGAIAGMLVAIAFIPEILEYNLLKVGLILVPAFIFLYHTYQKHR